MNLDQSEIFDWKEEINAAARSRISSISVYDFNAYHNPGNSFYYILQFLNLQKIFGTTHQDGHDSIVHLYQQFKIAAIEQNDINALFEVDQQYCLYLFENNQKEEALQLAMEIWEKDIFSAHQEIEDEYDDETFIIPLFSVNDRVSLLFVELVDRLLKLGEEENVLSLVEYINLSKHGSTLYTILHDYYKHTKNEDGLVAVYNNLHALLEDDAFEERTKSFCTQVAMKTQAAIYLVQFYKDPDVDTFVDKLSVIPLPYIRAKILIEAFSEYKDSNVERASRLIQCFFEDITNSSSLKTHSEIETIKFNQGISTMVQLLEVLKNDEKYRDAIQTCIYGNEVFTGLISRLKQKEYDEFSLDRLLLYFSKNLNRDELTSKYYELRSLFPLHVKQIDRIYFNATIDENASFLEDEALHEPDRNGKFYKFLSVQTQKLTKPELLGNWEQILVRLESLEKALFPELDINVDELSIHDLFVSNQNEVETVSGEYKKEEILTSSVPYFLMKVGMSAYQQGNFSILRRILLDDRLYGENLLQLLQYISE